MRRAGAGDTPSERVAWRGVLAGLAATLVGIGLGRFAYTPLIPPLIENGWFDPGAAGHLGAVNLVGYLLGALVARALALRLPLAAVLRGAMLVAALSFLACAWPLPFLWFLVWRLAAGIAGGVLMVLAAPSVLARVPPERRGLAGGIVFTGVGLGIALSGTLVPALLRLGLGATWLGLGLLALALTLLVWRGWEGIAAPAPASATAPPRRMRGVFVFLMLAYGLNAAGLVPHMVFLVDFVARGLGRGIDQGAAVWVLFGLGAVAGPILAGRIADRIGFALGLRLAFLVQVVAVALPAVTPAPLAVVVSSVVVGAFVPGVVPLVLGRCLELAGSAEEGRAAWGFATVAFALGQAAAAQLAASLFAAGADHAHLFLLGALALLAALAVDLAARALGRR